MKVCYLNFDGAPTIEAALCCKIGGLNTIVFNLLQHASLPHLIASVFYRHDGLEIPRELANLPIRIRRITAGQQRPLNRDELEDCL